MCCMLHKHGVSATYLPDVLVKMRTGGVSNASWETPSCQPRPTRMAHERAAADAMDVGDEATAKTRAMDGVTVKMLSVLQH